MDERLDALERLARLRESGLLSADELAAEKGRILAGANRDDPPTSVASAGQPRVANIQRFLRRRKWLLAGGAAGLLLTVFLVYITLSLPPSVETQGKANAGPERGDVAAHHPPTGVDLTDLLNGSPGTCAFGNRLRAIVGEPPAETGSGGIVPSSRPVSLPGFAAPITARTTELRPEGSSSAAFVVELPVTAHWYGLQVTRIRLVRWRGAEIMSIQLQFSDTTERVRGALNRTGFQLPAPNGLRHFEMDNADASIGVEPLTNGAALTCAQALQSGGNASRPTERSRAG